jgi:hypothetical protein
MPVMSPALYVYADWYVSANIIIHTLCIYLHTTVMLVSSCHSANICRYVYLSTVSLLGLTSPCSATNKQLPKATIIKRLKGMSHQNKHRSQVVSIIRFSIKDVVGRVVLL